MPRYDFKLIQELVWAFVVAAVVAIGGELLTFDQTVLDDPVTWGLAALSAAARAGMAAVVAALRGTFSTS